jgi:hypothetical protein
VDRCRLKFELGFERGLAPFKVLQLVLETGRAQAVGNGVDETVQTAGGRGELLALDPLLRMPSLR